MSTSKTARQAMNAGAAREAKADPFAEPEAKIHELIKQRDNKLFVIRQDFIDALIFAYDRALTRAVAAEQELEFIKTGSTDVQA